MGLDLRGLVEQTIRSAGFSLVVNNPLAQFGVQPRNYLFASIFPEVQKPENDYTEEGVQYRTLIANNGSRYSPVQIKGGVLTGSFRVSLAKSDIGSPFTASDYDAWIRLLRQSQGTAGVMGANFNPPKMLEMAQGNMLKWSDMTLNRPLLERNELMRCQAVALAQVTLTGDNNFREVVNLPNPTGHRVTVGGTWSSNTYDPYLDIMAGVTKLASKGYTVDRMIAGNDVRSILSNNLLIRQRIGRIMVVPGSNTVQNQPSGYANLSRLNDEFNADALPNLELYDLQYRTSTSSGFFWPRGTMALIATTGRDRAIDFADAQPIPEPLPRGIAADGSGGAVAVNTIGYTAIGRVAGQELPGRWMNMIPREDFPPRVDGEAVQMSFPVCTDPEALFILNGIA